MRQLVEMNQTCLKIPFLRHVCQVSLPARKDRWVAACIVASIAAHVYCSICLKGLLNPATISEVKE